MHLYSLRSERNWGIGDFTDLLNLMKYAAEKKLDFVGINPLHALFTSKPAFASPYSPSSREWLNPIYSALHKSSFLPPICTNKSHWQVRKHPVPVT
ncbi:4-alpha-glucanotransferase [Neisseria subflava]|nr:4-alpha-glucanotransferase [Neisseria subflava]